MADSAEQTEAGSRRGGRRSGMRTAADCLRGPRGRLATLMAQSDRLIRINRLFQALLPPHLQPHARLTSLTPQHWLVETDSAAWATRLRYVLPGLQSQLGAELRQTVPPLKLQIRPAAPEPPVPIRRPRLTRTGAEALEGAARDVSDERLGEALRRLARRASGGTDPG